MGTKREQASSCFLLTIDEDSIDGIYKTLSDCAKISKYAGGIGIAIHKIRSNKSLIRGTNGSSNGIVPMLKVFNETARYVDQCFTPDTIIYTLNGPKAIEDISIGDKVLTSNGNYANVNLPVRHEYNDNILEIQIKNAIYPIRVTEEHQIMALKDQKKGVNFNTIINRLNKNIIKPIFYDAKDLQLGDFLVFPIPKYELDIINYSEEDCYMYGILLGDGHISSSASGVSLNNITKTDIIIFVTSYLENRGIRVNSYIDETSPNCVSLKWSSANPGFKFTKSQLYDDNKIKKFDSNFLHLPKNKIKQIIKGLIKTDGCIAEKEISIEMTSYSVIESLRYMLLRLGALSSGYTRNRIGNISTYKNITTKLPTYVLRIPRIPEILEMFPNAPKSDYFTYMCYNNNIYSRIETITKIHYEGVVHDFEIDEPHDYTVAHLGIVHNGGGKRAGSIALYLEPWHADIEDFLKMKLNTGIDEERARDLFYAVWISDLFMKRVEADADWSLMCPDKCPGLYLCYGQEFEDLYEKYEREGRSNKIVKARVIWEAILTAQMETGTPYIGFKDAVNIKNNQKNLGTIQCSNLCHEICEYTSKDEIAVCNLASVALPKYIEYEITKEICKESGKEITISKPFFNFEKMREVVKQIVKNLNKIIDYNYYPVKEAEYSNRRNRPEGIGISGLSEVFALLRVSFDSEEARVINREIFENMYYAALEASMEIARKRKKHVQEYKRIIKLGSGSSGELTEEDKKRLEELKTTYFIIDDELKLPNQYAGAYSTFIGSPMSEGKFQFDLWGVEPSDKMKPEWEALRADILKHGIRNSLLIALMPTASTSQILGWNECIEPFTNNIYTRKTLAGTFVIVNKYLIAELLELGIWNQTLKDKIIMADGSVQEISEIPQEIRNRYKTVWELKQKALIDLAADRAPFVCQTQSMNLFVKNPTYKTLSAMHFYSWKKGLKTGIYYLRSQAKTSAQKFSVDLVKASSVISENSDTGKKENGKETIKESKNNIQIKEEPECIMCSS